MPNKARRKVTKLSNVRVTEVSLVDRPANQGATVTLFKREPEAGLPAATTYDPMEGYEMDLEKLAADLEAAQERNATLTAENADLTKRLEDQQAQIVDLQKAAGASADDGEDVLKSLDPKARAYVEELKKAADANAQAVQKMQDDSLRSVMLSKASGFTSLPGKADDLAAFFVKVAKGQTTHEDLPTLTDILAKADALAKDSLGAKGKANGNNAPDEDGNADNDDAAMANLEKLAGEIRKADASLTKEQAIAKALDENPDLYSAYLGR